MKILFWNICRGFRDDNREIDWQKVEIAEEYITNESPDVVVFNEADYLADYHEKAFDYRSTFAFDHIHGHQYSAHMGNCILSHKSMIDCRVHLANGRSGLACGIEKDGRVITVATVHTHPGTSGAEKASAILATAMLRSGPCVLVGDFNAVSPTDGLTVDALEFRLRPIAQDNSVSMATRLLNDGESIFATLQRNRFRDIVPETSRRHTMPSWLPDGEKQTQVRIDHALVNDGITGFARISDNYALANASDHRPIVVEIDAPI